MDAVTYPDSIVAQFIMENTIPLRVRFDSQPYATTYNITWTPTILTLDAAGKEHHRTVGFMAPEDLIPSLILAIGKALLASGRFDEALDRMEDIRKDYPWSWSVPEALYWRGVIRYKSTHNAKFLKDAYKELVSKYPQSEWSRRAYPYRLL